MKNPLDERESSESFFILLGQRSMKILDTMVTVTSERSGTAKLVMEQGLSSAMGVIHCPTAILNFFSVS
jgi:hypothetical protein